MPSKETVNARQNQSLHLRANRKSPDLWCLDAGRSLIPDLAQRADVISFTSTISSCEKGAFGGDGEDDVFIFFRRV